MVNELIVMVLCYIYISYPSGSIILGFLIILGYVIIEVRIYEANNRFLPKILAIINFIVVSCAGLSVFTTFSSEEHFGDELLIVSGNLSLQIECIGHQSETKVGM